MKKLILLLLLPFAVSAQKMPDMGLNKVRITEADETIVAEIEPVTNDIKMEDNKLYFWYSSNGVHSTQGGYSGKVLNGIYTVYYPNKNLKEQGIFKKGLKDGIWKTWNESGKLTRELTWKKGTISGDFANYDDMGNLKQTGKYENNLLEGHSTLYLGKDSTKTIKYHRGQLTNVKDLTIWQKLYLAKKNTDTTAVKIPAKKDKKGKDDKTNPLNSKKQ
jgi:antitoxin component YwqK of YwqJK toxin-antitoxin module